MPRVIVTADTSSTAGNGAVWLDEHVRSVHLSTEHAAAQFIERLAWAISDAENADPAPSDHLAHPRRAPRRRKTEARSRGRRHVSA